MSLESVDIRCPNGPQRLFMKLKLKGEKPVINADNLMEFACSDCKRTLRRQGYEVDRVLHTYNFLGEWIETYIEN